ncbi:MAG: sensor histidine kinase, partial [Pseudobdellovibrio sp.]
NKWVKIRTNLLTPQTLEIHISDSGSGIKPEIAHKIMDPFFTTKDVGKGTGLGLSLSRGIIEDHNGTLVYNSTSVNTEFIITLPLKQKI